MALFVGFMFVSCNDEDYGILEHKKNGVVDLYDTYSYLGEIHNDFQTNVAGDAAGAIVGAVGSAVASAVTGDKLPVNQSVNPLYLGYWLLQLVLLIRLRMC